MVSITNVSSGQAATYYQQDNYYTKSEGQWQGKGAEELGLQGEVQKEDFEKIINGQDREGNQIIANGGEGHTHRAGTDLTFSAPKSVSIMSEVLGNTEVREAHEKAVSEALRYAEQHFSEARQTKDGVTEKVNTGNLVIAKFTHGISRELDPQLHTHAVVMNMTQREDGQWRAVSNEEIYNNKMLIGQVYRNELAANLKELGYNVQSDNKGLFEIRGVDEKLREHFSQRSEQINEKVKELKESGLYPNADASKLREIATLGSRDGKQNVDMNTVRESWKERMEKQGYTKEGIQQSVQKASEHGIDKTGMSKRDCIRAAAQIQTEQESTFSKESLLKTAGKLSVGEHRIRDLEKAFHQLNRSGEIKTLDKGVYTTAEMQKIEKDIVSKTRQGHGAKDAIMSREQVEAGNKAFEQSRGIQLTQGQKDALNHILSSKDRFTGIQGDAGTGKTTMLAVAKEHLEAQGYTVRGLSPTGKAAAEIQTQAGIRSQTIDSFLAKQAETSNRASKGIHTAYVNVSSGASSYQVRNEKMSVAVMNPGDRQRFAVSPIKDTDHIKQGKEVWVVDEASMLGSRKMDELMKAAEKTDARVVYIGDTKQLQSIEAGKMFEKLQQNGDLKTIRMSEVQRQKDEHYKDIIRDISEKRIDKAFAKLESKNRISEIADRQERLDAVKKDFISRDHKNTIIVTAKNADRNSLNKAIRDELKRQGKVSNKEYTFIVRESKNLSPEAKHFAQSYREGDQIIANKAGVIGRAGAGATVKSVDQENHKIVLQTKDGKEHTVDLKTQGQKLAAYQQKEQTFSKGDKVVFLKNDKGKGLSNGQTGEITAIDRDGNVRIRTETGQVKNINLKTQYNYLDHSYAVTDYKAQGQTSKNVLYHAETSKGGVNYNQAYVAMTRGKENLKVYTDNKEDLKQQMKHKQVKTSTLDYEKSKAETLKRDSETLKRDSETLKQNSETVKRDSGTVKQKSETQQSVSRETAKSERERG